MASTAAPLASTAPAAAATTTTTTTGAQQAEVIVHHLNDSRSQRILWLLEELQVPYEVKRYDRVGGRAPKALTDIHPLGKSPVIQDGSRIVAESGAIVEYLVEKFDTKKQFTPQTEDEKLEAMYWMHFAEGTIMIPLVMSIVFEAGAKQSPFFVRPLVNAVAGGVRKEFIGPELAKDFGHIETTLAKQAWFAGDRLTKADFMMSFPVEVCDRAGLTEKSHPAIYAWRKKVGARPAYREALKRGGEDYAYKL